MVNPTAVDPLEHMFLSSTGAWVGYDDLGRSTVKALPSVFDEQTMNRARCEILKVFELFVTMYDEAQRDNDLTRARNIA